MELTSKKIGQICMVQVSGVVDSETVDGFAAELNRLTDGGERLIVLDMAGLKYINTAGLSLIADLFKKTSHAMGSLKLLHVTEPIRELLDIVRFTRIIDLYDDEQEAIESFLTGGDER